MWRFSRWCDSGFPLSVRPADIILPVYASRSLTLQIAEIPDDEGNQEEAVLSVPVLRPLRSARPLRLRPAAVEEKSSVRLYQDVSVCASSYIPE